VEFRLNLDFFHACVNKVLPDWTIDSNFLTREVLVIHRGTGFKRSFTLQSLSIIDFLTLEKILVNLRDEFEEFLNSYKSVKGCAHTETFLQQTIIDNEIYSLVTCKVCNVLVFPRYLPERLFPIKDKLSSLNSSFLDNSVNKFSSGNVKFKYRIVNGEIERLEFNGQSWVRSEDVVSTENTSKVEKENLKLGQRKVKFETESIEDLEA